MAYTCNKSLTQEVSDSTADCQHIFDLIIITSEYKASGMEQA